MEDLRAESAASLPPEAWLEEFGFYCAVLRARLSKKQCVIRQVRPVRDRRAVRGTKLERQSTPSEIYCASGNCKMGRKVLVQLKAQGFRLPPPPKEKPCADCHEASRIPGRKRCEECEGKARERFNAKFRALNAEHGSAWERKRRKEGAA